MEELEPPAAAPAAVALPLKCGAGGGAPGAAGTRNPPREQDAASSSSSTTQASLRPGIAAARARRRGGLATPCPPWKLEASPRGPPEEEPPAAGADAAGRNASSARQLGATLWEIQDVVRVAGAGTGGRIRRRARRPLAAAPRADADVDRPQSSAGCGGHSTPLMGRDKLHEDRFHARQSLSPASYTSSIGGATVNLVSPTRSLNFRDRSRESGCNLKTSTELLKVLNRIWSLEEQRAVDVSAIKGLKMELQHTQAHVQELMQERQRCHYEIDSLVQQVTENKMAQENKEHENLRSVLYSIQVELEDEKHLRKHSESLHRKLSKELSAMKLAFLKAVKDLDKEKKATILLEDLCDEFALGIRNSEEEVRVLKQRHVKEYEQKFDKSVVHISEAWLDERMQMQSADARKDSDGKSSITERLSGEIQSFLHARRSSNTKSVDLHIGNKKGDTNSCGQSLESVHLNGTTSAPRLAEDEDDNSIASGLHCFELNMYGGAARNHDLVGTRSVTATMYSPMRRLDYSNSVAVEGSRISNAIPCSKKDKAMSSMIREQLNASTPKISSHNGDKIAPIEEQNETVTAQVSRQLRDDLLKIESEAPRHAYLGRKSHDQRSRTSHFRECAASGDLHSLNSPARQPKNHRASLDYQKSECAVSGYVRNLQSRARFLKNQGASLDHEISESSPLDHEISESSPMRPRGAKDNTLKAKLLQARLEGQHARIRASVSGYHLVSTRK